MSKVCYSGAPFSTKKNNSIHSTCNRVTCVNMKKYTILNFLNLIINICGITTGPSPDWELGLRESVHQAFIREHHPDPSFRNQIFNAPLIGRHDNSAPFGDIVVLAKGQLYVTADGLKFLQEWDECSDCYNVKCASSAVCLGHTLGHHNKLLALWTVKKIRHRDSHYGHIYEIEYTISPVNPENENLIGTPGYLNYNVPGHIFVVRSDPHYYLNSNTVDKWKNNKGGIVVGAGHTLHSFPGFYTSYRPKDDQHHTTVDPKEYELYKKLIESLASKTSKLPHRFGASPTVSTEKWIPLTTTTIKFPSKTTESGLVYTTKPMTTIHYYTPIEMPTTTTTTKTSTFDIFTTKPVLNQITPEIQQVDVIPITTESMKPVTEIPKVTKQQLSPPQKVESTIAITTVTQLPNEKVTKPTTTQKIISTFVPSSQTHVPTTTIIEKIPYTMLSTRKELKKTTTPTFTIITAEEVPSSTIPATTIQKTVPTTTMYKTAVPTTTIQKTVPTTSMHKTTVPITTTQKTVATTTMYKTTVPTTTIQKTVVPTTTMYKITVPTTTIEKTVPTTMIYKTTVPTTMQKTTMQKTTIPTTIYTYAFDANSDSGKTTTSNTVPTTTHFYYAFETDTTKVPQTIKSTTEMSASTQQMTKVERVTTTQKPNDFLIDTTGKNKVTDSRMDINIDDIFGEVPPISTSTTTPSTTTTKRIQSDIDQALFGGRRGKQIRFNTKVTEKPIVENSTQIIFNNFYKASTDQSYVTSISLKVNRRKHDLMTTIPSTRKIKRVESNEGLENAALTLINHVRSINYLQKKTTTKPKYRKRNSTARRKTIRRKT